MDIVLNSNPLNFLTESSNTNNLKSYCTDKSFFSMTLDYIRESNRKFNDANKIFYKSIVESNGDSEIINESFHDFAVKVKELVDKFIKFIKSLFDKFISKLNEFVGSDKFIITHKKDLDKFTSDHEFEYNGYEFTFTNNIPVCNVCDKINEELYALEVVIKDNIDKPSAAKAIQDFYNETIDKLSNGYYDKYRALVLNVTESILQSDFDMELFSTYRNGNTDTESITINKSRVMESYSRFDSYKTTKSQIEREKNRVTKDYESLKDSIYDMAKSSYDKDDGFITIKDSNRESIKYRLDRDSLYYIDLYIKSKASQIQEMSNIHALAFSAKLDAMKACFVQDKAILYKALSRVSNV